MDIVASAPNRATAARALVDCATRAWRLKYPTSKNDDCAVVCLFLDGKPAPNAIVTEKQYDLAKAPEVEMKTIITDGNFESADVDTVSVSHFAVLEHSGATKDSSEIVPVDESVEKQLADKGLGQSKRSLAECLSTAQDEEWSALEGITRVNSLLSLPRFLSGDKRSASWRKWL